MQKDLIMNDPVIIPVNMPKVTSKTTNDPVFKTNGWVHDAYTDDIDRQSRECATALKHTYWTQEAEEMRNQIEQNAEMIKTNKNKNHRK